MSVSTLDTHSALIVIDLQNGTVAHPTAQPAAVVVDRANALSAAFREHGLPVVLVNVGGVSAGRTEQSLLGGELPVGWDELVPELTRESTDHLVTKFTWSAFEGTGLDEHLKGLGVTQVVLAGIATSIGVESTARSAYGLGYHVTLATDAMTDVSSEAHDHATAWVFPFLGETGTTTQIIDLLQSVAI